MGDQKDADIGDSWLIVNPIDYAEEATVLNSSPSSSKDPVSKNSDNKESDRVSTNPDNKESDRVSTNSDNKESDRVSTNSDNKESDAETSDGIDVISESSHLHESSTDDENIPHIEQHNKPEQPKADHASDSDSTSDGQPGWLFVDSGGNVPDTDSSKQFYLNCLQEPIQELSEHELGSIQSEPESDGISVISESDSHNDSINDADYEVIDENFCGDRLDLVSKVPSGIKTFFNGVLIGTILLATSSVFLGQYFNSNEQIEEELSYNEDFNKELQKTTDNLQDLQGKYDVPTALTYCKERHKSDEMFVEYNVRRCLNKIENQIKRKREHILRNQEIQKLEKSLKIKEQYLNEKEKFLIRREYEVLKAELKLKQLILLKKSEEPEKIDQRQDFKTEIDLEAMKTEGLTKNKIKVDLGNFRKAQIPNNIEKKGGLNKHWFASPAKQSYNFNAKQKVVQNKKSNGFKKFTKNNADKYDHEFKNNFKYKDQHKDNKNKKCKSECQTDKSYYTDTNKDNTKNNAKRKKSYEGGNSFNYNRVNNKKIDYEYFGNKNIKNIKFNDRKYDTNTNYLILESSKDNQTISGYWVGKLYKARSDMRNKEHTGDWYFDRASYRKRKRDKAKWYFDWMMDREILRYKQTFYM